MNLQKMLFVLSLSLSPFLCMGMHPYHNAYATHQLLQAQQQNYQYFMHVQQQQQYLYLIQAQQEQQRLMHIRSHQEQLRRQQWQDIVSLQTLVHSMQKQAEQLITNDFLSRSFQLPNMMKTPTKPSKVLEIVAQRK